MKSEDLIKIEKMVDLSSGKSESIIHKAMKKWICIQLYEEGVPIDAFEFEKKIKYDDKTGHYYKHTTVDVFVNQEGGVAYYCQCKNDYPWLYKFLEHVPVLKKNTSKQYVILPENLEALFPMRWQQYQKELKEVDVGMLSAPFSIHVDNKQEVQINMSYKALSVLVKLKNKYFPNKTLIHFIEKDLEQLTREGGEIYEQWNKVKW